MQYLYTFLFFLALPFIFARLLWRSYREPAYRSRLRERLGSYDFHFEKSLWVHAVSVGEVIAAIPLIQALQRANLDARCDVLILARGGGSMEDLWAFNDEQLAYAIANSHIPIVSGVGHETDFTIADFVADFRAATPTAAAESVVPDWLDFMARLQLLQASLTATMSRFIQHQRLLLTHQMQTLSSPGPPTSRTARPGRARSSCSRPLGGAR